MGHLIRCDVALVTEVSHTVATAPRPPTGCRVLAVAAWLSHMSLLRSHICLLFGLTYVSYAVSHMSLIRSHTCLLFGLTHVSYSVSHMSLIRSHICLLFGLTYVSDPQAGGRAESAHQPPRQPRRKLRQHSRRRPRQRLLLVRRGRAPPQPLPHLLRALVLQIASFHDNLYSKIPRSDGPCRDLFRDDAPTRVQR